MEVRRQHNAKQPFSAAAAAVSPRVMAIEGPPGDYDEKGKHTQTGRPRMWHWRVIAAPVAWGGAPSPAPSERRITRTECLGIK